MDQPTRAPYNLFSKNILSWGNMIIFTPFYTPISAYINPFIEIIQFLKLLYVLVHESGAWSTQNFFLKDIYEDLHIELENHHVYVH